MNMTTDRLFRSVVCLLAGCGFLYASPVSAQPYTTVSSVVSGGGGAASAGEYSFTATIGQPCVGATRVGEDVNAGGFWNQYGKATGPVTAADTGYILYSRAGSPDGTIWMRAINGSFDTMVCVGAWPRLSHDGRYVVHHRRGSVSPWFQDLYLYDFQTQRDTLLLHNGDWIEGYCWTDDDSSIVFDWGCGVQRINRDGTGNTNIFSINCYDDVPVIRPHGSTIAFHDAFYGLLLANDSLGRRVIPNSSPGDYWPLWSPDGQWISYRRAANDSDWYYYKIRPDGSGRTLLTHFVTSQLDANRGGVWTPDGSRLLVVELINGIQGIYEIATDGSGRMGLISVASDSGVDFVGSVTGNIDVPFLSVTGHYGVKASWNLLSLPITLDDYRKTLLFPTAISPAFRYTAAGYAGTDTLRNGAGYWLKFSSNQSVEFTGAPRQQDTVMVDLGWNMIGSLSVPVMAAEISSIPGGIVTSSFFGYDPATGYASSDSIQPGQGYWVKVSQPGKLLFASPSGMNPLNRIRIVSNNEQPPPPPEVQEHPTSLPATFVLEQNYPNPFNPATTIRYQLPVPSHVTLIIYDVLGRKIAALVDEAEEAGYKSAAWNASNVASGIYFYKLITDEFTDVKKLMIMK